MKKNWFVFLKHKITGKLYRGLLCGGPGVELHGQRWYAAAPCENYYRNLKKGFGWTREFRLDEVTVV